jgi:hypothetical protein
MSSFWGPLQFLSRVSDDYNGISFIMEQLPAESRVMMLWDGRGYYCDNRCVPDVDHLGWTVLVHGNQTVDEVKIKLKEMGITHIFFSVQDADFNLMHDPEKKNLYAYNFLKDQFLPARGVVVYRDEWVSIFSLHYD